jgi:hypothetical protein
MPLKHALSRITLSPTKKTLFLPNNNFICKLLINWPTL